MRLTKTIHLTHGLLLTGLLLAFSLIFNSHATHAATITVTTTDTATSTNDADCTLREAIENINTQTNAVNTDCAAGDGSTDTIIIPSGNIILEADLPQITTSMTIQGAGMGQTVISGAGAWTIFGNQPAPTDSLELRDITVTAYKWFALLSYQGNLDLYRIEVDGTGASFDTGPGSFAGAIAAQNPTASPIAINMTDMYVHNITSDTQSMFGVMIMGGGNAAPAEDITFVGTNITISGLTNTGAVIGMGAGSGILNAGIGAGDTTATLSNITVTNLTSTNDSSVGIAAMTLAEDKNTTLTLTNATIGNIAGTSTNFISGAALAAVSAGGQPGSNSASNVIVSNALIFNSSSSCGLADLSHITGGNPGVNSITSQGGNLSDDASCAPYFTQSSDQNNIAGLAATLSPLADNGGNIPTMALRENSPAVDSGVTIAGLTQDARLAARPQGSAYDSGAYESPFTKPATASLASTGQNIKLFVAAAILLVVASGVILTSKVLSQSHSRKSTT